MTPAQAQSYRRERASRRRMDPVLKRILLAIVAFEVVFLTVVLGVLPL